MSDQSRHLSEQGPLEPVTPASPTDSRRARRERSLAAVAELAATAQSDPPQRSTTESVPTAVVFSDEVPLTLHRRLIALSSTDPDLRPSEAKGQ